MKCLLLTMAMAITICIHAQTTIPLNSQGKAEYSDVVKADSLNASRLYSNAKKYITNEFVSGKDVTQLTDDNSKTVIAKGIIKTPVKAMGVAWDALTTVKVEIECRDGRYKYTINDLVFKYQPGSMSRKYQYGIEDEDHKGVNKKQWDDVRAQVNTAVATMIEHLKAQMSAQNNW